MDRRTALAAISAGSAGLLGGALLTRFCVGVDQRTVDLNLRPHPLVGNDQTPLGDRVWVPPSELAGALHIIFIGQSTNNNALPETHVPVHASAIYNMSIAHRGACFYAKDPLLSGDLVLGHHGMYLADSLIDEGLASKVILTNIICGGNFIADWVPGGGVTAIGTRPGELAYRIGLAARCIASAGLEGLKTIIDMQGGEWDSDNGHSQANVTGWLNAIVAETKRVGLLRPGNFVISHQNTRITNTSDKRNPIRAAQAAIVDGNWVRAGADIDSLGGSYRYDGTHFSTAGGQAQAALKLAVYRNYLTAT